jgi:hypothetical protein
MLGIFNLQFFDVQSFNVHSFNVLSLLTFKFLTFSHSTFRRLTFSTGIHEGYVHTDLSFLLLSKKTTLSRPTVLALQVGRGYQAGQEGSQTDGRKFLAYHGSLGGRSGRHGLRVLIL